MGEDVNEGGDAVQVHPVGVFEQQVDPQDPEARVPMLLMRDDLGREVRLPIGSCDGFAIHIALTQQAVLRPLTHDLGLALLERLHGAARASGDRYLLYRGVSRDA